jgi:hypothetical protein
LGGDAMTNDQMVIWAGHPGVYLVIERTDHTALLRERGRANAPMVHTMLTELTSITETEAVERLMRAGRECGAGTRRT